MYAKLFRVRPRTPHEFHVHKKKISPCRFLGHSIHNIFSLIANMALLDSRTMTVSLSLFFLPVLILCIILSLPLIAFVICKLSSSQVSNQHNDYPTPTDIMHYFCRITPATLYVIAWALYLYSAQTDTSFNLPYSPTRILKINYAILQMIIGLVSDAPIAASYFIWRYVSLNTSEFDRIVR